MRPTILTLSLYSYSEVEAVSGFVGNFEVKIRQKARSVDAKRCTGCGICTEKCPSRKTSSEFELGLKTRGAIYIPFSQALPKVPVIDREHCLKFQTGKCGICSKVCPAECIDYDPAGRDHYRALRRHRGSYRF
jgi:heterodisulfide reductase subunit A